MKSIVVVSDTHGNLSAIEKILPIMQESDYVFCLGDFERDIMVYKNKLGDKIRSVKGNCDGGGEDLVVDVEGHKILLTHGDRYGVKYSKYKLLLRAKELGVSSVFYGHTHLAEICEEDRTNLINPGCMTRFGESTYCYAVVHNNKLTATIVPVR